MPCFLRCIWRVVISPVYHLSAVRGVLYHLFFIKWNHWRPYSILACLILHDICMLSRDQGIQFLKIEGPSLFWWNIALRSELCCDTDARMKRDVLQIRNAFRQMAVLGLFLDISCQVLQLLPTYKHTQWANWVKMLCFLASRLYSLSGPRPLCIHPALSTDT